MLYYYAYTGHKVGLERARRGAALIQKFSEAGVKMQLLLNDFRAGVALKEHGIREYVTIETIQDIDAIAQMGDSIIIDSNEDDHGRLVKYVSDFDHVCRFAHDEEDQSVHGEGLFRVGCSDDSCEEAMIIDDVYFEKRDKKERLLFFLRDYDHDKTILGNEEFFNSFEMELLLGHYFFVKYEDDLAKLFSCLHEPEEYTELLTQSSTVITASSQAALEARASGARVIFIQTGEDSLYPIDVLHLYGIETVKGFDVEVLKETLSQDIPSIQKELTPYKIEKLLKKLS